MNEPNPWRSESVAVAFSALDFVQEFLEWAANHDQIWCWRRNPNEILADDEGWKGLLLLAAAIHPEPDGYPQAPA